MPSLPVAVASAPAFSSAPLSLQIGDLIVHLSHGVGRFYGLETVSKPTVDPVTGIPGESVSHEYLLLEYADGDRLYVPAEQTDRVRPFVSANPNPTLDKLKGQSWAKSVARAQREASHVAQEMVDLYAARAKRKGHAYGPDTKAQRAMETAFAFDETPDQAQAIADIKRDLEAPRPMDRLLVGDVGYGKTEVAVRAAFKVASQGRQVAVLCPTSVLAAQHYKTFTERFKTGAVTGRDGGDLKVVLLSRFVPNDEQKETVEAIHSGDVDVVIGTHRLLSGDITWKNLGLMIVDEEQRFGVHHKDALKSLRETRSRASVDVLTMTATPIPRTLSLATSGVLDVSVIADPPHGRAPVETVVCDHDDATVRKAILREIERGGQVYYLHNRVESLEDTRACLQSLVPEARFGIAHGQMDEAELDEAMHRFYEHAFDVLVCTTIIEIGLDVANANTLIIENADRFGLAQLHQLRGRVGRSDKQAYTLALANCETSDGGEETTATARLSALRELTAPGSGHLIAERDLQLRGAGSLLGLEQSGSSAAGAIGYDLFMQLLQQAVTKKRGQKLPPSAVPLPVVELPVLAASLPANFVPDANARLVLYDRAGGVRSLTELADFKNELIEKYGPLPKPAEALIQLTELRLRCRAAGVKSIASEAGGTQIKFAFRQGAELLPAHVASLNHALHEQGLTFEPKQATLHTTPNDALAIIEAALNALAQIRRTRKEPKGKEPKPF